jgi:hypothetical protein
MHVAINVKSPNNISKWQMGFNSAFKGLKGITSCCINDQVFHKITKHKECYKQMVNDKFLFLASVL